MHNTCRQLLICITLLAVFAVNPARSEPPPIQLPVNEKFSGIFSKLSPYLEKELKEKNLRLGSPIFIRIFKIPRTLEVWMEHDQQYRLFKSYPICSYSGHPGPKLQEGDWQSPEGFYTVSSDQLNPWSDNHLSFDIGYPNNYDKENNRTGSAIMVHGGCTSQGCYAMSDHRMEEIYTLANSALEHGQLSFSVHIFPFAMTNENLQRFRHSPWISFWENLKTGYDIFEHSRKVPLMISENGRYHVRSNLKLAFSTP
jgi:murein L,D-transpeptidase YafK